MHSLPLQRWRTGDWTSHGPRRWIANRLLGLRSEQFGMQVMPLLLRRLFYFHLDAVGIGVGVVANARYLPGDFPGRLASGNAEAVPRNFACDVEARLRPPNRSQLITEVAIQSLKISGEGDPRGSVGVKRRQAVIDIHHVGRLDEGVVEIFVGGIERVVDLERAAALAEAALDADVPRRVDGHQVGAILIAEMDDTVPGAADVGVAAEVSYQGVVLATGESTAADESKAGKTASAAWIADEGLHTVSFHIQLCLWSRGADAHTGVGRLPVHAIDAAQHDGIAFCDLSPGANRGGVGEGSRAELRTRPQSGVILPGKGAGIGR